MNDKITVVTVCYNSASIIEETIMSVINQTYDEIEYIIVDGLSNDGTIDVINKYKDSISTFVSERDKGVYDAMNKSIELATGDWIIFMNAGDRFSRNTLISDIFNNKNYSDKIAVIFGNPIIVYPNAKYIRNDKPTGNGYIAVNHQCAFTRRNTLIRYKFNTAFKIAADADFFKKVQDGGDIFQYINTAIAEYEHYSGISSLNVISLNKELDIIYNRPHNLRWLLRSVILCKGWILLRLFGSSIYVKKEIKACETSSRYLKV